MGYSNGYLSRVVMGAALILAMIGFVPGLGVSWLLYDFVGGATFLPLDMYPARAGMVFALILGMCVIAGLLAMRKLRDATRRICSSPMKPAAQFSWGPRLGASSCRRCPGWRGRAAPPVGGPLDGTGRRTLPCGSGCPGRKASGGAHG
jgi:hypothetical protein